MFYKVGEFDRAYFVYDDRDESCELVSWDKLRSSNIVVNEPISCKYSLPKLLMSCGLSWDNSLIVPICFYTTYYSKFVVKVVMELGVVRTEDIRYSKDRLFLQQMSELYGYMPDYALMMYVYISNVNGVSNMGYARGACEYNFVIPLQSMCFLYKGMLSYCSGMLIPFQMFLYTYKLFKEHDIDGIFRAYNGLFDKDLVLMGRNVRLEHKYDCKIDKVVWRR